MDSHSADLQNLVDTYHRARWWLVAIVCMALFALIGVLGYLLYQTKQAQTRDEIRIIASCAVAKDIGEAPISTPPGAKRPSELGVKIVVDFRNAYVNQGCPGTLAPPSAGLKRWAAYYSLSILDPTKQVIHTTTNAIQ